jgi:hypothetical protein
MKLKVRLQNGEEIEAYTEEWLAALISELPRDVAERVFTRIRNKSLRYSTPGSHILHAEPGVLSGLWKARG